MPPPAWPCSFLGVAESLWQETSAGVPGSAWASAKAPAARPLWGSCSRGIQLLVAQDSRLKGGSRLHSDSGLISAPSSQSW